MKKIISVIIAVISVFQLAGCGTKTASEVTIDYGHSAIYSQEDMGTFIADIVLQILSFVSNSRTR